MNTLKGERTILATAKQLLSELEAQLDSAPIAAFQLFDTPFGPVQVHVTARLVRRARRKRVWKSAAMCTALKNAAYGYDPAAAHSRGGADGIFRLDRRFTPPNPMMKKLFADFLDKPDPLVQILEEQLATPVDDWIAVRLVSHHMRLLGVLAPHDTPPALVLVDFDVHDRS